MKEHPCTSAILCDKGDNCLINMFHTIIADKKPRDEWLLADQLLRDRKTFSDKIFIEDYYERMFFLV